MNPDGCASDFIQHFYSLSFLPLIACITRPSGDGGRCLDHIWHNQFYQTYSGVLEVDITDHFPVFTVMEIGAHHKNLMCKIFRDHSDKSIEKLKQMSSNVFSYLSDCFRVDEPFDATIESFSGILYELYNKCCPLRKKTTSSVRLTKPWITDSVLLFIDRKHALFRDFRRGVLDFELYKSYSKKLKKILGKIKIDYYHNKFKNSKTSSKDTWNSINFLLNKNRKTTNSGPKLEDFDHFSTLHELSNSFNEYFSKIGPNLSNSVPLPTVNPLQYMNTPSSQSFYMHPCDVPEIEQTINSLPNKTVGMYNVPTFIFKELKYIISPILCNLFNTSLMIGQFPLSFKSAIVTPIFKSGNKSEIGSYRPISVLPILSKVFEKLMTKRLNKYLDKFSILKNNQFGYRKATCTSDAVLEFLNNSCGALEMKRHLLIGCVDFSKAFDCLDHKILLSKLNHIGVRVWH